MQIRERCVRVDCEPTKSNQGSVCDVESRSSSRSEWTLNLLRPGGRVEDCESELEDTFPIRGMHTTLTRYTDNTLVSIQCDGSARHARQTGRGPMKDGGGTLVPVWSISDRQSIDH